MRSGNKIALGRTSAFNAFAVPNPLPSPESFFSPARIWAGFDRFQYRQRQRKKRRPRDPLPLQDVIANAHALLPLAFTAIGDGSYALKPAHPVLVVADKPRTVYQFEWTDQFVLDYFAEWIAEIVEPQLPDSLFSFRKGRSNRGALAAVGDFMRARPGQRIWALRRDVKSFGESLVHAHVLADFERHVTPSPVLRALLASICAFPRVDATGAVVHNAQGLPTGSYCSWYARICTSSTWIASSSATPMPATSATATTSCF